MIWSKKQCGQQNREPGRKGSRRIPFLFLLALLAVSLIGAGKVSLTLFRNDKLIDLNKAIVFEKPGTETPGMQPSDDPGDPDKTDSSEAPDNVSEGRIVIIVHGEEARYDGSYHDRSETLNTFGTMRIDAQTEIVLEDDFAETHFFKELLKMLQDKGCSVRVQL